MDRILPVAIHGASGRMGEAILRVLSGRDDVRAVGALVRAGSDLVGKTLRVTSGRNAASVTYTTALRPDARPVVLIDFSAAAAFDDALACAMEHRIGLVSGTTGLSAKQRVALDGAAATIPILWSANFSLGVAMLAELVSIAARTLGDWDCVIAEAHHSAKKDAPSGTALALGRAVTSARGQDFDAVANITGSAHVAGGIDFAVIRAGDIVGEHTVMLATRGERIELTHRATDRDIFARGAVAAALWIADRPAGKYVFADMLVGRMNMQAMPV